MEELRSQAGWAKTFGLPLELISAEEAQRLFPPMSTDGVLGRGVPAHRRLHRSEPAHAARSPKARGAAARRSRHSTRVTGIDVERGRVAGVETDKGAIETEVVVNAGGMFAAELGRARGRHGADRPDGARVPDHEAARRRRSTSPTMRDPSLLVYFRGESGGLVMGGYERDPAPWGLDGIPADFNGKLLAEDWDRFEELMTNALVRVPELADAEVIRLVNGPEAFTPDGEFILGPTEVPGFWVAAGFCAHGLAGAGGMGKLVAEWIVEGMPGLDVWEMDSRRFGAHYREPRLHARPDRSRSTRPTTTSSTPATSGKPAARCGSPPRTRGSPSSAQRSARSRAGSGPTGSSRTAPPATSRCRPRGWAGQLWSPAIGAEHLACRETAAIFDETSFAKIEVSGEGAAALPGAPLRQPRRARDRRRSPTRRC